MSHDSSAWQEGGSMFYTVSREGGMDVHQFDAYVRSMNQWGIDIGHTRRTPEPGTRARWLPVWQDRAEAERFAEELQTRKDRNWRVYPVDESEVSEGGLGPVDVAIALGSDGCSYGLDPYSRRLIHKRFPNARPLQIVSIRTQMQPDYQTAHRHLWDQVVRLLTGLTDEQLDELGGYRLYDQDRKEFLRQPALPVTRVAG
jgi:hypothetical protein